MDRFNQRWALPVLAICLSTLPGCPASAPPHSPSATLPAGSRPLIIDMTGNVGGTVEPCGCTQGELGGLARRALIISEARQRFADHYLFVDYGNLLYPATPATDLERPQRRLRAATLANATSRMRIDAFNLSVPDLEGGASEALSIIRAAGLPVLSANVVGDDGRPVVPSHVTVTRAGLRIAITGIAETGDAQVSPPAGFRIIPPADALRELLPRLRKEHDFVLVLSHARHLTHERIGQELGPLLLLGSQFDQMGFPEPLDGGSVNAAATTLGRHVARLNVDIAAAGSPFAPVSPKGSEAAGGKALQRANHYRLELIPVSRMTGEDPETRRLIDDMKKRMVSESIETFGRRAALAASRERPVYAGAQSCQKCHQMQYDWWQQHAHSKAYATLEQMNSHTDMTCIGCHSTGYNQPGGYDGGVVPAFFAGVQCEACHGVAAAHVRDVLAYKPGKLVAKETCLACHGKFHEQKEFNYEKMLGLASCPSARPRDPHAPPPEREPDTGGDATEEKGY
ncbi:MAG: hypothetical protein KIT79_13240 [Deltaproteobacteria bacterium]|nr:hypothetical protein [Deltaproteobacteria bacterium]